MTKMRIDFQSIRMDLHPLGVFVTFCDSQEMPKETIQKTPISTKNEAIELSAEFANLGELLDARNGSSKGLSNQVSLEVAYQKGLYPYKDKMPSSEYEQEKLKLQAELLKVQQWVKSTGQRVVILFEGRDAAGKGGTI